MIKEFVKLWDENKDKLEEVIRNSTDHCNWRYKDIVILLFEHVINKGEVKYDTKDIDVLCHSDYTGTLVFILHDSSGVISVEDYVYTNADYGSCSCCDTLQAIQEINLESELPNDEQVQDYMMLCLHLLQRCHRMLYEDSEGI